MRHFLDTFHYRPEGFLVDEVTRLDPQSHEIEARLTTRRPLPFSDLQRTNRAHPPHMAAGELLQATGCLGCLHAWFFYGCRWDEGWAGFGNRVHRADFKRLVKKGPDLLLASEETRARVGSKRIVIRYQFRFRQEEKLVYFGDQSAMFVRQWDFGAIA
jgi:hypothetical protein